MGSVEQRYASYISSYHAFRPAYLRPTASSSYQRPREPPELAIWRARLAHEESLWAGKKPTQLNVDSSATDMSDSPLPSSASATSSDINPFDNGALSASQSTASISSLASDQTQSSSSSVSIACSRPSNSDDHTANQQDTIKKQRRGARGRRGVKAEKMRYR